MQPQPILSRLIGHELATVTFVRDYLQLGFEGPDSQPILTSYVWPVVKVGRSRRRLGSGGYRDSLCGLIGSVVMSTTQRTGQGLVVTFRDGSLTVHPEPDEVEDEIAMLSHFADEAWMAWYPGEQDFEDISRADPATPAPAVEDDDGPPTQELLIAAQPHDE